MNILNSTCIILAGGKGTRIKAVLGNTPKCLASVEDFTFLQLLISNLSKRGITKFILALGVGSEFVVDELKKDWANDFDLSFIIEKSPLGTGGSILNCMSEFSLSKAIVTNGDSLITGNYTGFLSQNFISDDTPIGVAVTHVADQSRYGGVIIDSFNYISGFHEKGLSKPGTISVGLYHVSMSAFNLFIPGTNFSFETHILSPSAGMKKIKAYFIDGKFIDIGIPSDYLYFQNKFNDFLV